MNDEIEIIERAKKILTCHDDVKSRYAANIKILEERLIAAKHNLYRLGVIGITSCGKSTMINALLGEALLPMKAKPTSNQLVSCRKGSERKAIVFFEDDHEEVLNDKQLTAKVIGGYTDEAENPHNKKGVRQIDIISPNFPFDERIVLVDSPGLDAFGLENHDKLTMSSLLPTVDLCVFMTTFKPQSDDRNRSVLNAMAQHEKPVIVIQNMIDALLPSPDGKLNVEDVALQHHHRLERIIEHSNIIDKSQVQIVQYSATWALNARIGNDFSSIEAKRSNHQYLVNTINNTFNAIKPEIDNYRLRIVKRQIDEILETAQKDAEGTTVIEPFEHENTLAEYDRLLVSCQVQMNRVIKSLKDERDEFGDEDEITQNDLDLITDECEKACKQLNEIQTKMISKTEDLCKSLNMDSRSLFSFKPISYNGTQLTISIRQEPQYRTVNKKGFWNSVKRFWGNRFDKDWGTEVVTDYLEVPDHETNKRKGLNQYETTISLCESTVKRWYGTYSKIDDELSYQIGLLRKEHEARKQKALTANRYREIASELTKLRDSIQLKEVPNVASVNQNTKGFSIKYNTINISPEVYGTYRLARHIKQILHRKIGQIIFQPSSRDTVIWGQDKSSETHFIKQLFGLTISDKDIKDGINQWKSCDLTLFHQSTDLRANGNSNVVILVNSTQIGERYAREAILNITKRIPRNCRVFLVVQNFQESINGNNVEETIENMLELGKDIIFPVSPTILIAHSNPIFNIVAIQSQQNGFRTQKEEIEFTNDISKKYKFHYLIENQMNTIQSIIRHLNKFK